MITKDKSASITLIVFLSISFILEAVFVFQAIKLNTPDTLIENCISASVKFTFLMFWISDLLLKGKRTSAKYIVITAICALSLAASVISVKFAISLSGDKYRADAYASIITSIMFIVLVAVYCLKELNTQMNKYPIIIVLSTLPLIFSVILISSSLILTNYSFIDLLFLVIITLTTIIPIIDSIVWVVKHKKRPE